jgi:hypothetical protein
VFGEYQSFRSSPHAITLTLVVVTGALWKGQKLNSGKDTRIIFIHAFPDNFVEQWQTCLEILYSFISHVPNIRQTNVGLKIYRFIDL